MSNRMRLANFLRALDEACILDFDKHRFNHRLKIQKYIFIAQKLGFATKYNYSLYIHGPYSSNLADDYYRINDFKNTEPVELDSRFVRLVKNKSEEWLELASTILMIRGRYEGIDDERLVRLVTTVKPFAQREQLIDIIRTLERCNVL